MDTKIIQFSKGIFEDAQTGLILSDNTLSLQVEEGRAVGGTIYISNDRDVPMQGIFYSDCQCITLTGIDNKTNELAIGYEFSAAELMAGETVNSTIHVITNCGETSIPVTAVIEIPAVSHEGGSIKDLMSFALLAKESPADALDIFKSDDFIDVFLYRDNEKQLLYKTLMESTSAVHAMEEFLVAARQKNRVVISIDRNSFYFDNVNKAITDKVIVSRNTWGSVEVIVSSNADFITPSRKRLWTDQFINDSAPLLFTIEPEKTHGGENSGKIILESVHQTIEINITCSVIKKYDNKQFMNKRYYYKVVRAFVDLRIGNITEEEFGSRIDGLTVEYREFCEEYSDLAKAYAAILNQTHDMKDYVKAIRKRPEPSYDADQRTFITYSIYLHVLAKYYSVIGDREEMLRIVRILSDMYEHEYKHWFLFYILLITEPEYKNSHNAFSKVKKYIAEGCKSPLLYSVFCEMVGNDSSLIHEWNDSMVVPLVWGAERNLLNVDTALGFSYHISRIRGFNQAVYRALCKLYNRYGNNEMLMQICRLLINAGRTDAEALYWYEKGIEHKLRITQLYELYLRALPSDDRIIPHVVLMYFAIDDRLSDMEKAKLFAYVVKGKKTDSVAYKAYTIKISNFAREQLLAGNINADLAVLYEDSLKLDSVDEITSSSFPLVMFRHEVICTNPQMKAVCVVHKEIAGEQIQVFKNGCAYVDIYSTDAYVFMIDQRGNRYYQTEDYTLCKLLNLDSYADRCFEVSPDNDGLLTYMYMRCNKYLNTGENVITIRRMAQDRLNLTRYYRKNNLSALMYHYYEHAEGERLDELLENLDLSESDRYGRSKWIELYIIRGMHIKALKAICTYGYDNIDMTRLGNMCDALIMLPDEESVLYDEKMSDMLLRIACEVFAKGGYSRNIIKYLVAEYIGATKTMLELWKAASGLDIDTEDFEERIIVRLLTIEDLIIEGLPVFESYLETGEDNTLKKAYISYIMYLYIRTDDVSGIHISGAIWDYIHEKMMDEYNTACLLARLKDYSQRPSLDDNEKLFCEINLTKLYKNGIIMDFYNAFEKKLGSYIGTNDREIIQCVAVPGIQMKLRCTMADGNTSIMKAPEIFFGIYVKDLIVFSGEIVKYEFFEEKGGKNVVYKQGEISYNKESDKKSGRLGMLNDMIDTMERKEYNELYDKMKDYIILDEASKDLFTIL